MHLTQHSFQPISGNILPIDYAPLTRHTVGPLTSEGKPFHGKCREARVQAAREEARQIMAQADQEGHAEADAFYLRGIEAAADYPVRVGRGRGVLILRSFCNTS